MQSRISIVAAVLLWCGMNSSGVFAQTPIKDIQALEGAWECTDTTGVHGFIFEDTTRLSESNGTEKFDYQTTQVRVYERKGSEQKMGYFVPGHTDVGGSASFDGKRLAIHFAGLPNLASPPHLSSFDLDVSYEPDSKRWVGTWSSCVKPGGAVLERPHPKEGDQPAVLVGDWISDTQPNNSMLNSNSVHIRQGSDGVSTLWFDIMESSSVISINRVRSRETNHRAKEGRIATFEGRDFVLYVWEYRFEARLSEDGKTMNGKWINESTTGVRSDVNSPPPPPNFPTTYRRMD